MHFDHAGASLMAAETVQAMQGHLALEARVGGYEAARQAETEIEGFYSSVAHLIGADAREIAFVESGSSAWSRAVYALPWRKGDRVLFHKGEYGANYLVLRHLAERTGIHLDLVPSNPLGEIDLQSLEEMIRPETRMIALTHVAMHAPCVQPVAEVGAIARKHTCVFALDACQSLGQLPLNVRDIDCQILAGTGRKFLRGPRGAGLLYIDRQLCDMLVPQSISTQSGRMPDNGQIQWASGARRFETWERNFAGQIGLKTAIDRALEMGLATIAARIGALASILRTHLEVINGIQLYAGGAQDSSSVVFTSDRQPPEDIAAHLSGHGISVSIIRPDQMPLEEDQAPRIRASVHVTNTEEEIAHFVAILQTYMGAAVSA